MKTKHKKKHGVRHVTFQHPDATSVFIAGSFNGWAPDATPLVKNGDGMWAVELALPAGRHEYRIVADGEWVDDPQAVETVLNAFGGVNAVIVAE